MIWKGSPLGFALNGKPLAYDRNESTLIFGPPGSFKTVGPAACSLLDEPGKRSFVVMDPKLELAAITANYRRKVCGKDNVKIINPYGMLVDQRPDLKSDGWNPLGDLDPDSPTFGDDCGAFGDALVKTKSNESQPHFPDTAREGITGTIMAVVKDARSRTPPLPPSLPAVRAILTQESAKLKVSVEKMLALSDFDISSRLARFLATTDEVENVKSTVGTETRWMTKPMRDDMAGKGGVSFRALYDRPTTIYVGLPIVELTAKANYLRLVLSSALRALYRDGGTPTTLLVDEGFVLGHHAEIENALSALRGYGSRLTIVFQSLQQIKKLYPETWGLFTGGAVLGFSPADLETAQWLSERSGHDYVAVLRASDPSSVNEFGARESWGPEKRERIPVAKMFGMPQGVALAWLRKDEAPRVVRVKGYFEIPELNARADRNPYHKGGSRGSGRVGKFAAATAAALVAIAVLAVPGGLHWSLRGLVPAIAPASLHQSHVVPRAVPHKTGRPS